MDGTGLPVLDRNLKGKTRLGTLWGYVGVCDYGSTAAYLYCSTGKKIITNAKQQQVLQTCCKMSCERRQTTDTNENEPDL